jgi:hypothetical protein
VFGFDAFQGLQEDWAGHRWGAGAFSTAGKLPKVPANVELVVGWIDQTLPSFLEANEDRVALLHIDTDTYTPAKIVLDLLGSRLHPGSLILFDDFFGYPGWRAGEFRALEETLGASALDFLGFSNNQALAKLK